MRTQILKAISERRTILINTLIFTSFKNYNGNMEYRMRDDYNGQKWDEYNSEKDYINAVMQRVNYYIRKGYPNVIEIK